MYFLGSNVDDLHSEITGCVTHKLKSGVNPPCINDEQILDQLVILASGPSAYLQAATILLTVLGVPYCEIPVKPQELERIYQNTLPQIYIGTHHIGGSTELFDEYISGKLGERLAALGIEMAPKWRFDPAKMLRAWLTENYEAKKISK